MFSLIVSDEREQKRKQKSTNKKIRSKTIQWGENGVNFSRFRLPRVQLAFLTNYRFNVIKEKLIFHLFFCFIPSVCFCFFSSSVFAQRKSRLLTNKQNKSRKAFCLHLAQTNRFVRSDKTVADWKSINYFSVCTKLTCRL